MKMSEVIERAQEILEEYGDLCLSELEYGLKDDLIEWEEVGDEPVERLTVRKAPFSQRWIVVVEF